MVIHIKPEIGKMFQEALVVDDKHYLDSFPFLMENMAEKVQEYCAEHPTVSKVIIYGASDFTSSFKENIERKQILTYAKQPLKVVLKEKTE
jgi:hypothetical protein